MRQTVKAVSIPRLVIAAPQGHSGKTTITLGLCAALAQRSQVVQPFKKGPDYIDPSWLSAAAGRACRSIDPFFLDDEERLRRAFIAGARDADIAILEGNHGLFDSLEEDGLGSTAAVARSLHAPVILVVNAARMTRSAAAMVRGYQTFEPGTNIAAVVLNNVSQSRHEAKLRAAIEKHCQIPVCGAFRRDEALTVPDRHLGLIPQSEDEQHNPAIEACRRAAENNLDIDLILKIAQSAQALPDVFTEAKNDGQRQPVDYPPLQIGVIRDQAFSFYYPENLEALQEAGARLVFINSLHDQHLPTIDALYIGGGFPEIFMEALTANSSLRKEIRAAAENNLPIYAECGGLMYLSQSLTWNEHTCEMVGVLPCDVVMTDRPQGHGYVIAETNGNHPFLPPGTTLRGHEFHHSTIRQDSPAVYRLERGSGIGNRRDGIVIHHVVASYLHLHALGSPEWAPAFVAAARRYRREQIRE